MDTLFRDNEDPRSHFDWIKKNYIEVEENKKIEDEDNTENTYDDNKSKTD